ncbi:MAG: DUF4347 domain-containing protein [Pirellulaceae bacterium]
MTLRLWLQSTRSLIEEAIEHVSNRGTRGSPGRKERPLKLVTLEDRIVFSATPLLVLPIEPGIEPADSQSPEGTPPPEDDLHIPSTPSAQSDDQAASTEATLSLTSASTDDPSAASSASAASDDGQTAADALTVSRRELVIIDAAVDDYQQLIDDLLAGNTSNRNIEFVLLDDQRDGIDQISELLAQYDDLDALHIVSHGTSGSVKLGSEWLDVNNVNNHAGQIAQWADALTSDADLLFYGCDLAASHEGQMLVESLSALTGADVAASTDGTGHAIFGGDWELEYASGQIETNVAFSLDVQQNWGHLLDVTVDATSTGTAATSANSVTVSHTTSGSNRLMLVGISFGHDSGDSVSSVTYNGTSLSLVGARDNNNSSDSRVEIWSLVAPDTGTHDVVVNFSGTNHRGATIGVMSFTGVDQPTALGSFASAEGDSSSPSATVASSANEMVFGVVAFDDTTDWDLTPGAGQTERWDLFQDQANGGGSTEAGSASVVTSWSVPTSGKWVAAGVSVKPVANQAPTIGLPGGAVNYTENDPATVIDGAASVSDTDSPDFDTGTLTVDFTANGTANDRLAINHQGTGAGQIGVSGSNVTYQSTLIGTFTGGTDGSTPLVVTFNSNANETAVQALMRNITYQNVSEDPLTAARTVRFVLTDGDGGTSNTETETINVTAINDDPVAANDPGDYTTEVSNLSPVSYWRLGETSGTAAADQGTAANDGTYVGPGLGVSGAISNDNDTAADFTRANNDYVEIAHDDAYLLDNGSVQLWFNADDLTQNQALFSKDSSGYDTGGHLNLMLQSNGQLYLRLQSASGDQKLYSAAGSVSAGQWHHVVVTFGDSGMQLFLDGNLVDSNAYTGGLGATSGGTGNFEPIAIGANTYSSGNLTVSPLQDFFDGRIDEVAIFGSQLSQADVQRLYFTAQQDYTVVEDGVLNVNAALGVLANDTDVDGGAITVNTTPIAGPSNGSLTLNADGSFAYTPDTNFYGSDSFTYEISDGNGGTDMATATVTVTPVNDDPITAISDTDAAADYVLENAANGTAVGVTAFADDPDGIDTVSYSLDDDAGGAFPDQLDHWCDHRQRQHVAGLRDAGQPQHYCSRHQ